MRLDIFGKIFKVLNKFLHSKYGAPFLQSDLMWELASLSKASAMIAIMGTYSEDEFYASAKKQAEEVSEFMRHDDVVLDLGCGIGEFERYLHQKCKDLYAVDITSGFLRIARKEYKSIKNVHFLKVNGMDLKIFQKSFFNYIFCIGVFERIPKKIVENYIKEFFRVLKSHGTAYLQFVGPKGIHETYIKDIVGVDDQNNGKYVIFHVEELKMMFLKYNFKILNLYEQRERIYVLLEKPLMDNLNKKDDVK